MAATDQRDDLKLREAITAPFSAITDPAWWHRHLDPEERRRVMNELALTRVDHFAWRFTVMLTLSVVVAVMGLSANSAAVVIGAMLLAPLMTPVLATAAAVAMSSWGKAVVSLVRVVAATAWCIGLAYALSMILPEGQLPGEVSSRTQPDVRDLVVALAAGAAGSYATVRKDASAALPGVAVAVALVPPLGTVGITLEAGQTDLAVGAMLLYTTNLAAIILAGVMVFIATGFVPPRRLSNTGAQLLVAGVIATALVGVVAIPLLQRWDEVIGEVQDEVAAREIVDEWLGPTELSSQVDVSDGLVLVRLEGRTAPPDATALTEAMQARLGEVRVVVEWVRTEEATTTVVPELSDEETLLLQVGPVVDQWLIDASDGGDWVRDFLAIEEGAVRIDAAGPGNPPSAGDLDELSQRLQAEVGTELTVRLNWTARETISPTTATIPPVERTEQEMRPVVDAWASASGLILDSFGFDGEVATIEVTGAEEPLIYDLTDDLNAVASGVIRVDVLYTERRLVTTTLPPIDVFGELNGVTTTATTEG
ncbi:MAG: DUF389 domain-containing protein [Actinomycetota bacterium]